MRAHCCFRQSIAKPVDAAQVTGMPEDEARYIFQQLLVAIDYCHRLGIGNRDIKACCRAACCLHSLILYQSA